MDPYISDLLCLSVYVAELPLYGTLLVFKHSDVVLQGVAGVLHDF